MATVKDSKRPTGQTWFKEVAGRRSRKNSSRRPSVIGSGRHNIGCFAFQREGLEGERSCQHKHVVCLHEIDWTIAHHRIIHSGNNCRVSDYARLEAIAIRNKKLRSGLLALLLGARTLLGAPGIATNEARRLVATRSY